MTTITIDIDLDEIETEDLISELTSRGYADPTTVNPLITSIYEKRRFNQDFTRELDDLIYNTIGRI